MPRFGGQVSNMESSGGVGVEEMADRFAAWVLRSVATVMLFAGASVLVAGLPVFGFLTGSAAGRRIAGILLQVGGVLVVGGATAIYLSRPQGLFFLANEQAATSETERTPLGGWLIALAIALVFLPAWLVLRLQPFLAEWRRVFDFLATSNILEGASSNAGGLVLLPLAAVLSPPFVELAAMCAFVVASAILLVLLLKRSHRFPRLYLVCVVLVSALVIVSVRGSAAALLAAQGVEQLIEDSNSRPGEAAELREGVGRYTSIVGSTAAVLLWTLCGYLPWAPAMFASRRVRTTFAKSADDHVPISGSAADIEAITRPPRFPG
jgi:Protein of unknown function (DUF2569)